MDSKFEHIEENGIPVPEPHDKIHGDNSNYGLYDERIHHECVGKTAGLESGAHQVIHASYQEKGFPVAPGKRYAVPESHRADGQDGRSVSSR